ncbi:MAG: hypothetical protein ACD_47C00608G0004 [uncultured bacterium]|nr:MAG: hypothetical protein ACD_47C00608G0004 [uncultured bacterium]
MRNQIMIANLLIDGRPGFDNLFNGVEFLEFDQCRKEDNVFP